ncbi:MAG: 3-methyl-2-oxobutanoate dehydrogenase subunit alpha [Ktedonobacteraceae bacterium]
MSSSTLISLLAKNLYERMLLTRLVDEYVSHLYTGEQATTFVSCRGYEAAQVGSAVCIEVGQDFTLPHYRDLGVILAIGMSPYEVFCTHLQSKADGSQEAGQVHWSYHKHNTVTGSAPVATQILHAAGIAFASKLRKVPVVTIAYCGDDVVTEADFLEGIRFSAHHHLPIIFICEHSCQNTLSSKTSCLATEMLPDDIAHYVIDGFDVLHVYETMQHAIQHAREGLGPVLLEVFVSPASFLHQQASEDTQDPLVHCKRMLQAQGEWDEEWAAQLHSRLLIEVEQAMHDALRDTHT